MRTLIRDKPRLLIGCPMCGPFGATNNINDAKMSGEEKQLTMGYGRKHLEFSVKLYEKQRCEGRYFLHEHLELASSWHAGCIEWLSARQGVVRVVGDQCRYGLKPGDGQPEGLARTSIGFVTDSFCIATRMSLRCPNRYGTKVHHHVALINGHAKAAQAYTRELCRAICNGLIERIEMDRMGQFIIAEINVDGAGGSDQMKIEAAAMHGKCRTVEEDQGNELEVAWDDVSGAEFDPESARKARAEEMGYFFN